jgi:glycosyltransferase involved in cell wall biosynthesis
MPSRRPSPQRYALTLYPLSAGFKDRFEQVVGCAPTYLSVRELRQLSPFNLLRALRNLNAGEILIPVEDETSRCVLPILKSIAGISGASSIRIVTPDFRVERSSRWKTGQYLAQVAIASAFAARAMTECKSEVDALLNHERHVATRPSSKSALYLNANLWFGVKSGGSVGHVAGVVNALAGHGYDVALASVTGPVMIRPDVRHIALDVPPVIGMPFEKNMYAFHRSAVAQLERDSTLPRPGFIYQRMSTGNYTGASLARRWKVPFLLEYNGSEVWIAKNWCAGFRYPDLALAVEESNLRHADLIITISEVLADELRERGIEKERILWYPNCVDPSVFDPSRFDDNASRALRSELGIREDAVVVMFIGTFGQWHGVEVLARAIRQMAERQAPALHAGNAHFVLVGDGLKMAEVQSTLSSDLTRRFATLTGLVPQADAPKYLAMADILVSPHVPNNDGTRFFGSPTKLFEYMAMGKAIVASDLDQIGQVLKNSIRVEQVPTTGPSDNETALAMLAPPGDVPALVKAIAFMVEHSDWRATLGRNARAEALKKYTWAHHTAHIIERLDSIGAPRVT